MGLFRKLREKFHDDWCSQCTAEMEVVHRQLYALPTMMVGSYVSHSDPGYYKEHLVKVERKAEIPTGMYACGIIVYRCPQCGHRAVKLSVFLPVRDQEKLEEGFYFENGELDDFIWDPETGKGESLDGARSSGSMGDQRINISSKIYTTGSRF